METSIKKLHKIEEALKAFFVERDDEVHGLTLALLARVNLLLLGPPGTAKSKIINAWSSMIHGASVFSWLLTRFSTPEELFGPYSLKGLEEDKFIRITKGKLPDANVVFLDEIFKCNPGVLNSLLTVLNEGVFFNDGEPVPLDLLTTVGASNEIPEDEDNLQALYDRFVLKYKVMPVRETANFLRMLANSEQFVSSVSLTFDEIRAIHQKVDGIEFTGVAQETYRDLRAAFQKKGIIVTDRTYNTSVKLLKAEALFHGREEIQEEDFEILQHAFWINPEQHRIVYSEILAVTNPEKNEILEIFTDAVEVANTIVGREDAAPNECLEVSNKLKTANKRLNEIAKRMDRKGRNVDDVKRKSLELENLLGRIFRENLSLGSDVL